MPRQWPVSLKVETNDRWRTASWLAGLAVAIAGLMAIAGLPPLDLHMPPHYWGIMDPLCGGTRAIRLAVMGEWSESWRYNPIGVPLLLVLVLLVLRAIVGLTTGRWFTPRLRWTRRRKVLAIVIATVLIVALEINQQAHADLLMSHARG